ncbi:MAG TPA: SDR family oxidoreductase [Ktedonobacteraceae bacterium]|nr:SDR family oxidoreductase [Ktedonobacteraceae bacterium]
MFVYKGKTALITGASSGIGRAFARALAERGMSVVLVARSEERLRELATELSQRYAVRAEVIAADLSQEGAVRQIQLEVQQRGLVIDMLINNAGFATNGSFETLPPERDHQQVMVDVTAVVDLTHAFVPALLERSPGVAIINVASTAGFQPLPYMAVYGASKAFVLSFSQALTEEYRARGLRVLALCPGATETSFFDVAGESASVGRRRTPEQVVTTGLQALEKGSSVVIDGFSNALMAQLPRFFPRWLIARVAGQAVRPQPAPDATRQSVHR